MKTTGSVRERRRGPAPGTPRAPRMRREDRERQLLDVAEEVFGERSYNATTIDEIASRAGITKPVIYDHFKSKEHLLEAVVARLRDELVESTVNALDGLGPNAEPREYFRTGVRSFMEFFDSHRVAFQLYNQELAVVATAGEEIENVRLAVADQIARRLARMPGLPPLPRAFRSAYAEIVIAVNERAAALRLRHPELTVDEAVELVMTVLWSGLGSLVGRVERG